MAGRAAPVAKRKLGSAVMHSASYKATSGLAVMPWAPLQVAAFQRGGYSGRNEQRFCYSDEVRRKLASQG